MRPLGITRDHVAKFLCKFCFYLGHTPTRYFNNEEINIMTAKSICQKIYIMLILMGAMGIVTYYILKLLGYEGSIIPQLIILQIVYNTTAANAIVRMLKKENGEKK